MQTKTVLEQLGLVRLVAPCKEGLPLFSNREDFDENIREAMRMAIQNQYGQKFPLNKKSCATWRQCVKNCGWECWRPGNSNAGNLGMCDSDTTVLPGFISHLKWDFLMLTFNNIKQLCSASMFSWYYFGSLHHMMSSFVNHVISRWGRKHTEAGNLQINSAPAKFTRIKISRKIDIKLAAISRICSKIRFTIGPSQKVYSAGFSITFAYTAPSVSTVAFVSSVKQIHKSLTDNGLRSK